MADPLKLARQAEPALLDLLRRLLEIESPTDDQVANDRLGRVIAMELGIELQEVCGSGGSDANLTAAVGAPTVDSMGAVGENPHAGGEYGLVDELLRRTALLVHVLASLLAAAAHEAVRRAKELDDMNGTRAHMSASERYGRTRETGRGV